LTSGSRDRILHVTHFLGPAVAFKATSQSTRTYSGSWCILLLVCILLFVLLLSCTRTVSGPGEPSEFPSKLYPYEVVFDAAAYKQRREDLVAQLPPGALILVTTNSIPSRNGDVDYEFRPASVFYYLTGFDEPNAVALIRRRTGGAGNSELIMCVEERSAAAAQWLGPVYGPEGARKLFGADSAYASAALVTVLSGYLDSAKVLRVYANLYDNDETTQAFRDAGGDALEVFDVNTLVDGMRVIKTSLELKHLRRAIDVSVQSFQQGIRAVKPYAYEYEVESIFDLMRRLNGCPRTAFGTIVASGPNITTIHYTSNSRQMLGGDLVMIDFGAEYGYYAADVTRTFPVSGTFAPEQAAIYEIVNASLGEIMAAAAPGVDFSTLSLRNTEFLIDGLIRTGVISGTRQAIISSGQYRLYIPAGLGHPIGLDVHDPWSRDVNTGRILRENMVLAIEPHIYLGASDLTVAPAYRGICVRIEDDILITNTGCEVMSKSLPRARVDIEGMMKK
jgi:Xaa-Pro aminopeptidase